jgi:hypothetical protein
MKVAPIFDKKDNASSSSRKVNLPPIPFERAEVGELKKGTYASMKLCNNPGNADSPGYDIHVKYFKEGSCEEFLTFETDLMRVFAGQAATTGPLRFATARRLLEGTALTTFNLALGQGPMDFGSNMEVCGQPHVLATGDTHRQGPGQAPAPTGAHLHQRGLKDQDGKSRRDHRVARQ